MRLHHLKTVTNSMSAEKFLVPVLDGLRSIFCRHLGRHRSYDGQLGTSSFSALVEDLGRMKVDLVGMQREIWFTADKSEVPKVDIMRKVMRKVVTHLRMKEAKTAEVVSVAPYMVAACVVSTLDTIANSVLPKCLDGFSFRNCLGVVPKCLDGLRV